MRRFPSLNLPRYESYIVITGLMLACGCRPQSMNGWDHGEQTVGTLTVTLVRDDPSTKGPEVRPLPRAGSFGSHYVCFGGDLKHNCDWIEEKALLVPCDVFTSAMRSKVVQDTLPLKEKDYSKMERILKALFSNDKLTAKHARPIYVAIGYPLFRNENESLEFWARRNLGHRSGRTSLVHYSHFRWTPPCTPEAGEDAVSALVDYPLSQQ